MTSEKRVTFRDGEILTWDTEFWGFPVARTDHLAIDGWARRENVRVAFALIPASDADRIEEAQWRGWKLRDVRVTLDMDPMESLAERHVIFPATDEHGDVLCQLARRSHQITRFYNDPVFPEQRCDDLYMDWLGAQLADPDWTVLASLTDRTPRGYCSLRADRDGAEIGLIAVEESWRRLGVGRDLVAAAVLRAYALGAPTIRVVTQGQNVAALRTFEKVGFRVCATDLWFHKTYW